MHLTSNNETLKRKRSYGRLGGALSSVGRASGLQPEGRGFKSPSVHHLWLVLIVPGTIPVTSFVRGSLSVAIARPLIGLLRSALSLIATTFVFIAI